MPYSEDLTPCTEFYAISGTYQGNHYWISSLPEYNKVHDSMGEYGIDIDRDLALFFGSIEEARKHLNCFLTNTRVVRVF